MAERQWRAPEEEGLARLQWEELLMNRTATPLRARALEWATRLVGGAAAVQFDANRKTHRVPGLDARQIDELAARVSRLDRGVSRITLSGEETSVIALQWRDSPVRARSSSFRSVLRPASAATNEPHAAAHERVS